MYFKLTSIKYISIGEPVLSPSNHLINKNKLILGFKEHLEFTHILRCMAGGAPTLKGYHRYTNVIEFQLLNQSSAPAIGSPIARKLWWRGLRRFVSLVTSLVMSPNRAGLAIIT